MMTSLTSSSLPGSLAHVMSSPMFIKLSSEIIKGAQWPVSFPKMNGLGRTEGLELGAVLGEFEGDDDGELEGL